ncbi:LysR family transcriptional regulator [Celeribacter arenosi]|uniref:LysR family transcriptional regulator n=1 Tax=Celeribacter arenosi TaxID=792649 RepID=A0ABP7KC67_9RHOB
MDNAPKSFDWTRARAFLATAEEGSLSAAARRLGLTQPTLGRQVDALETELGVVLFERFGRGLQLTPAGRALLPHVRAMGDAADALHLAALGHGAEMEGEVRISLSDAYAGLLLPDVLRELRMAEPRISVHVLADNDAADLMRREADIAIRNFRPTEPDLVARRLHDTQARLYGAPSYLTKLGPLRGRDDLRRAEIISPGPPESFVPFLQSAGLPVGVENCPIRCTSFLAMWEMVKAGLGLGVIDARIGNAEPEVHCAMPTLDLVSFPVWLVAHREVHRNARLRFVYDFLAARF